MAKQKGDANLNKLRKDLDQIVGKLQTIQRNIASMREAGKSAKQIYNEYGKELEKLQQDEEKLNDLIEQRKELTKNEASQYAKYVSLKKASDREQKKITKELSDIEDKAFKRSQKAKESGLAQDKKRRKATLLANDRLELQKVRGSRLSVNKRLKAELELLNKIQRRYNKGSKEYKDAETQKVKALQKAARDRERIISKYEKSRPKEQKSKGFLGGFLGGFDSSEIGKGIGRLTGIGTVLEGFRRILGAVRQAIVGSFKAAVDFEAQLAQLQAVTGINNNELSKLEKNILDVAGSTKFTSEQIVELQTELGKLGFSVDEIEKATLAVAETAQALGEQVGPVAQKIGQILNQYNLSAAETTMISDTLVSVINSSALSFEGFGTALQYIGPLGAEVGTTFQETSAAMAILADNGFTASRIGTGLRGILTELSTTGKDLTTVIAELAKEEISLSEAVDLVGKRNAAQLISLIDNIDVLENAEEKYYNVGAAAIASAQQVDTYAGNLDLLRSAFNRVQIEFGNFLKYTGLLRAALKLLDEQGYRTSIAMEFLSQADPEEFSQSLASAADESVKLADAAGRFADKQKIYSEEAKKLYKEVLTPNQLRYAEAEERIAEIKEEQGEAAGQIGRLGRERYDQLNKELKSLEDLQDELKDYKVTSEDILALQENIADQIERQAKQIKLQKERNIVEEQYADTLKLFQERRDEENISLDNALKLRADIIEKEIEVKEARDAQKVIVEEQRATVASMKNDGKELLDLAKEELSLKEARLEQYDQELDNLANKNFSEQELLDLAQKEYELEFARARNSISERKKQLKDDQAILDLQIKTNQNEIKNLAIRIENTKNSDEKLELEKQQKELIEKQTEAEQKRNQLQSQAYSDIQGYLNEVEDKLREQNDLWTEAGFSPETMRILQKATERLNQMRGSVADLAVDFPEVTGAADNLINSLRQDFADKLKDGGALDPKDVRQINESITKLFEGAELTEEQKQRIRDYVFSGLTPTDEDADESIKKAKKLLQDIFGEVADAAKAYNETALENTKNRLDAELDAIKNRYKVEEEILKSQLDNQLITENQFRLKQKELRRAQIAEENDINRRIFDAEKKSDLNVVAAETAEALASNILNNYESTDFASASIMSVLSTVAVLAAGAAKADAIRRRKFYPVTYEEGGIVNGPSHAEGGVPFTVQGVGGYEMEGGEFIVNKKAAAMHRGLLEKINSSYTVSTSPSQYKFASGGMVTANANESVNYLKAIAEATTSTAIGVSKPVRAYVSDKDLRSNATERTIRDRNDRL